MSVSVCFKLTPVHLPNASLYGRTETEMRGFLVPALLVLVLVVGSIDDASAGRRRGKAPPPAARNRKKVRMNIHVMRFFIHSFFFPL